MLSVHRPLWVWCPGGASTCSWSSGLGLAPRGSAAHGDNLSEVGTRVALSLLGQPSSERLQGVDGLEPAERGGPVSLAGGRGRPARLSSGRRAGLVTGAPLSCSIYVILRLWSDYSVNFVLLLSWLI